MFAGIIATAWFLGSTVRPGIFLVMETVPALADLDGRWIRPSRGSVLMLIQGPEHRNVVDVKPCRICPLRALFLRCWHLQCVLKFSKCKHKSSIFRETILTWMYNRRGQSKDWMVDFKSQECCRSEPSKGLASRGPSSSQKFAN